MAAGVVSTEQARSHRDRSRRPPERVGTEVLAKAEAQLVEWAAEFGPKELRRLARRILEVVAPEIADAEEARRLEKEEQAARRIHDPNYEHEILPNGDIRFHRRR
jgi:hypothetical protein